MVEIYLHIYKKESLE